MTDTPTTPSPERQPADAGGGLLPCPFCDTTCHVVAWPREFRGRMVAMIECFTDNCYALITADTPADAIAAWNRRSPTPQAQPDARAVEGEDTAFRIASDLHAAYEQLIYGLPRYLEAENLTDEENMIREAYITLDVTAHRLANLSAPAADDGWRPSREALIAAIGSADRDYCDLNGEPCCSEEDGRWRAHIADAILALHPAAPTDEVGKS